MTKVDAAVTREQILDSLTRVSGNKIDESMIVVHLTMNFALVAAFPEKFEKSDFEVLKQAFRNLTINGYL